MNKIDMRKVLITMFYLFFFSSLPSIVISDLKLSTPNNVIDSIEDIITTNISTESWKPTHLHSELDITTMVHSNQNFTITFNEIIRTGSNYVYQFRIFEDFDDEEMYIVRFSATYDGELIGPDGYWNGTGWDLDIFNAVSVGTINANTIEISIPTGALFIQNSHNWVMIASYTNAIGQDSYFDICPDDFLSELLIDYSGPSSTIIGYELFILIGFFVAGIIIVIYNHKRI